MTKQMSGAGRLAALMSEESVVTDEQKAAIEADGNFLLDACPGSGKTRTAGIRAAWLALSKGWKVAATSYTNVAVAEIRAASAFAGAVLTGDHFCGTLHSLLLRYVFYPFGHLVMECKGQPTLVIDPPDCPMSFDPIWVGDDAPRASLWMYEFRRDGTFSVNKPPELRVDVVDILKFGSDKAAAQKKELFREGYASRSDAMFVAMEVLENHKNIADLIAARFDEIIVDEAQDTSDVQLRCLEILKETKKLRSLVLVGDPQQSIYEWQGSDPLAGARFAAKHGMETLRLTKNFRSSQAICDVAYRLAGRDEADEASGEDRDFGIAPEILLYSDANGATALEAFAARLQELGIDPHLAPVLARTTTFVSRLNRIRTAKANPAVKVVGTAAASLQRNGWVDPKSLGAVEALVRRLAWGTAIPEDTSTRVRLRDAVTKLLGDLPLLDQDLDLKSWIAAGRDSVKAAVASLSDAPVGNASSRFKAKAGDDKRSAKNAFDVGGSEIWARTIHSAKGESHPAVMLAAAKATKDRDHAREWIKAQMGDELDEETRVGYVAVTRARRYCAVALPSNTPQEVIDAYVAAGFVLRAGH